jgi:hypothetical protein
MTFKHERIVDWKSDLSFILFCSRGLKNYWHYRFNLPREISRGVLSKLLDLKDQTIATLKSNV